MLVSGYPAEARFVAEARRIPQVEIGTERTAKHGWSWHDYLVIREQLAEPVALSSQGAWTLEARLHLLRSSGIQDWQRLQVVWRDAELHPLLDDREAASELLRDELELLGQRLDDLCNRNLD